MKYIISLFIMAGIVVQAQQLKLPALSPTATITQAFSTSEIEISYSRPSMRGRGWYLPECGGVSLPRLEPLCWLFRMQGVGGVGQ